MLRTIRTTLFIALILSVIAVALWIAEGKPKGPYNYYPAIKEITVPEVKHIEIVEEVRVIENDQWNQFICTGYSTGDPQQGTQLGITKAGFDLSEEHIKDLPICAVDTNVIPLYSVIEVEELGAFIALDTGKDIQGYWIDLLFDTKDEAIEFGRQIRNVRIIGG